MLFDTFLGWSFGKSFPGIGSGLLLDRFFDSDFCSTLIESDDWYSRFISDFSISRFGISDSRRDDEDDNVDELLPAGSFIFGFFF